MLYLDNKSQSGLKECRSVSLYSGGLLYWQKWNNMHVVTSDLFLLIVYIDYLSSAGKMDSLGCMINLAENDIYIWFVINSSCKVGVGKT